MQPKGWLLAGSGSCLSCMVPSPKKSRDWLLYARAPELPLFVKTSCEPFTHQLPDAVLFLTPLLALLCSWDWKGKKGSVTVVRLDSRGTAPPGVCWWVPGQPFRAGVSLPC